MRVVDEGLSTGGKPEVELTGAVSDMSADVTRSVVELRLLFCRTPGPFLRSWRSRLCSARVRGRAAALTEILWRPIGSRLFVRINVLAKLPSHCPVCWHLRGMACLRGTPIAPRLGASGVGLPGHRRGLNKARKNAAGRN